MVTVIDEQTQKNIESWLQGDYDTATKDEIRRLQKANPDELIEAFYTNLSFGTGGLRGIMGIGTNRMNNYTVRSATQGLSNYILKQNRKDNSVVIGYDNRNHSREFAEETAKVLAANGIKVFLYRALRPVALVSFGVLYKKSIAGIMITASHNPPKYNGYKVYWDYGGQILPPHDKGIIEEVGKITSTNQVKTVSFANPLIQEIDGEIDAAYLDAIRQWQFHPGDNHTHGRELHVVYTSLHGAGITIVPSALRDWGFTNLTIVKEQETPDGNFPTIKSPNPEEHETLSLGIQTLKKVKGDLLLATDPDTDRLGVVIMNADKPFFFNGNELACILLEHVCRGLQATDSMPAKPMFIKTIVTTELFRKIAEHHGGTCLDVLTGFKYIGEKIAEWEEEIPAHVAHHHYIFGGEESYGYLLGTHVRDKDAIISSTAICECALQLKREGKTLIDFLYEIYEKYGVFREKLLSLTFEGKEGSEKMKRMMEHLRKNPPQTLAERQVVIMEDYLSHVKLHLKTQEKETLVLPKSDVLRFWLEDGTKIVIRPSGTEPKIKLYCAVQERHHHEGKRDLEKALVACDRKLDELLVLLKKMLVA